MASVNLVFNPYVIVLTKKKKRLTYLAILFNENSFKAKTSCIDLLVS